MGKVTSRLTITSSGNVSEFSNTKNYTEEVVTKFYVDATHTFTDVIAFSPDDESPSKTATSTAAPQAFCMYNSGTTALEIQITTSEWTTSENGDHAQASEGVYNSMILPAGEMFFSNNLRLMQSTHAVSGALAQSSALALATSKVSTPLTAVQARGGQVGIIDGDDSPTATAIVIDDGAYRFREGDYLFVNAGDGDVIRVVSVESNTAFTVERGFLGYTAQTLDNDSLVYMYAGSHLHNKNTEDDSGVNIRTDKQGRFKGYLLGDSGVEPRGTAQTRVASGIVPGSVSIQFPEHGGYQNLGVSISPRETTSLVASTAYAFRITDSLGTTSDITFTTDSSDLSWGKVVSLINQAFDDATLDYKCSFINGDVRFNALKWLDGDSITLVDDADSSNEPWGVGNVPDTGAHETPIKTRFPFSTVTDIGSGKKIKNTKHMLVDDGNGNLNGDIGSGTVNYDTGIIDIAGPYRSEFKTSFAYGSAHSGIPTRASGVSNMAKLISARSTNNLKNGELTLICYS